MLDIIKEGSGNKEPCRFSIGWFERNTLNKIEIRSSTVKIYKNAFTHLKNFFARDDVDLHSENQHLGLLILNHVEG